MRFDRATAGIVLSMVLVAAFVAMVGLLILDRLESPDVVVQSPPPKQIAVYIDGAVATPGLYTLDSSARLQQVIEAAGGLRSDADVRGLNLAGRLGDGEHITIPTLTQTNQPPDGSTATVEAGDLLNINLASAEQLEALPGIGPVLAQRIVAYRDLYGPFGSIDELRNVEGISDAILEQIRPLVTVDG